MNPDPTPTPADPLPPAGAGAAPPGPADPHSAAGAGAAPAPAYPVASEVSQGAAPVAHARTTAVGGVAAPLAPAPAQAHPPATEVLAAPAQEHLGAAPRFSELVDALLRDPGSVFGWLRDDASPRALALFSLLTLGIYAGYGVLVGLFAGGEQVYLVPLKLAGGAVFCAAICLPSLLVFASLSGGRVRAGQAVGLLVLTNALSALLLVGFAPVAWVFTTSVSSLGFMGSIHVLFWGIALYFGLRILPLGLTHFQATSPRYVKLWIGVFVVTLFQTTTAVRPLLGPAQTALPQERKFFVAHWLETLGVEVEPLRSDAGSGDYRW